MRLLCAVVALWPGCVFAQIYTISTFMGGELPVNVPGTSANIGSVRGVAADATGNAHNIAHSWKRRTGPRKVYRSWRSPVLGGRSRDSRGTAEAGIFPRLARYLRRVVSARFSRREVARLSLENHR